jgi:RNA polymerase sigma-32 factor
MSAPEEQALAARARDGDRAAAERLVKAHYGLVVRTAMRLRGRGCSFEDLLQQGQLGLLIAIRRFDPTRGVRLSTYGVHWMRACMLDLVLRTHGPLRLGTTRASRRIFFGLGRALARLERDGGDTSAESIASALDVGVDEAAAMLPRLVGRDVSLDDPSARLALGGRDDDPEQAVGAREERWVRLSALRRALERMSPRDRHIVQRRFLAGEPASLQEVGHDLGLSRERVRQLERAVLGALRSACADADR